MKKLLKSILAIMLCLAVAFPATTTDAATSVKTQAQQPVKQFFKYAKTLNLTQMGKYVAIKDKDTGGDSVSDSQTKQLYDIIKKQHKKKFSYTITGTTLSKDKKTATIKVKVTYRSLYKAGYYGAYKTCEKSLDYILDKNKSPSDSKVYGWLIKYLKKGVDKYSAKLTTKTLTIKTKQYKSGWKIIKNTDELQNVYSCDILKGMNAAFDDL